MRVLTHNTLRCHAKGVVKGYPLLLAIENVEINETEVDEEFLRRILPSLDWEGLTIAAAALEFGLPKIFDPSLLDDADFVAAMHRLLVDVQIINGTLTCPETGRVFPICNGIPSMVIPENEV